MKKYIKDNVIIKFGTPIKNGDEVIYSPTEELYLQCGWVEYIPPKTIKEVKADKIKEIEAYDSSNNVNNFIVNGENCWISKADRVGLMNSTTIEKAIGKSTTSLWFNNHKFEIDCNDVITMLSELEEYALQCYNVTEEHKATILSFNSIENVNNFDITADYPEQLTFNI